MKLTDVASLGTWTALEKAIHRKSGLNASVFDANGVRITDFREWSNRLCPLIKSTEKGQSYICAVAHQNIAAMARNTRKPVIEECDAGMMKAVVPIFVRDEFLGVAGGCGHLLDDGEVDVFMVHRTTGIDEDELETISRDIRSIRMPDAEQLTRFIQAELQRIITAFEEGDSLSE